MDRRLLVVACIMTRACRNRAGKGKERLFPRKIIDDRARTTCMHMYTLRAAVRPLADEGCEASKGENRGIEKEKEKRTYWNPITRVSRCSSTLVIQSKQSITHLLSGPCTLCVFLFDGARGFRPPVATLATRFPTTRRHAHAACENRRNIRSTMVSMPLK